jgi:hypothetical protein
MKAQKENNGNETGETGATSGTTSGATHVIDTFHAVVYGTGYVERRWKEPPSDTYTCLYGLIDGKLQTKRGDYSTLEEYNLGTEIIKALDQSDVRESIIEVCLDGTLRSEDAVRAINRMDFFANFGIDNFYTSTLTINGQQYRVLFVSVDGESG